MRHWRRYPQSEYNPDPMRDNQAIGQMIVAFWVLIIALVGLILVLDLFLAPAGRL